MHPLQCVYTKVKKPDFKPFNLLLFTYTAENLKKNYTVQNF